MFLLRKNRTKTAPVPIKQDQEEATRNPEKITAANSFMRKLGVPGNNIRDFSQKILSQIAKEKEILQGVFLINSMENEIPRLKFLAGYACIDIDTEEHQFLPGEGLPGQVAKEGKILNLKNVPEGYIRIRTGLGEASPNSLIIIPIKYENQLFGVLELASFHEFTLADEKFFYSLSELVGFQMKELSKIQ
jgi:GAF domain-containing protein